MPHARDELERAGLRLHGVDGALVGVGHGRLGGRLLSYARERAGEHAGDYENGWVLHATSDAETARIVAGLTLPSQPLPCERLRRCRRPVEQRRLGGERLRDAADLVVRLLPVLLLDGLADRKSTRLNSSHSQISYAVFCLKKKKNET